MNYLAENAIVIWMGGAVLLTLAAVVYSQLRSNSVLLATLAIGLSTVGLLVYESVVETPREAVSRTLDELAAAIEANDLPSVLTFIAPAATEVRADAQSLMPLVTVNKARITSTPVITWDGSPQPHTAVAKCQGLLDVTVKANGVQGPYMDRITINFVSEGKRWLIDSYTPSRDWHRAIKGGP